MMNINSTHEKLNTDLQLQVDELSKKLETSVRIKGEYEELIAKLFEDKSTQLKINTALKELDRGRRRAMVLVSLGKVIAETGGPKAAALSSPSNSLTGPQGQKSKKKLNNAKS